MSSLASKHTTLITSHCHRLRKASGISDSLARRARLTTVADSSTTKGQQPLVISRRAWIDFKKSKGITKRRPDASKRPKSDDEKPWPRNMQIAGYVGGALAVPYIILWTITSNPTLREWFGPYIPLDKLRTHYGKLEWDAQSYSEEMENAKNKEKNGNDESQIPIGYYQFPEEAPFEERQRQAVVESMDETDINVTLTVSTPLSTPSSSLPEESVTKKIAAKTLATEKNLSEYIPSTWTSLGGNKPVVAVDFLDQNNKDTKGSKMMTEGILMTDADSMENIEVGRNYAGSHDQRSQQLAEETQTMSKWAYVPKANSEGSQRSTNGASVDTGAPQLTKMEIEMERLKYEISELEKNLRDPMCTRSIDDMTTELRGAKRELSKLTWKRRFGFSQ